MSTESAIEVVVRCNGRRILRYDGAFTTYGKTRGGRSLRQSRLWDGAVACPACSQGSHAVDLERLRYFLGEAERGRQPVNVSIAEVALN